MTEDRRHLPKPFYSTAKDSESASPRLLLVSFHFPPGTAVGGLRWQQMAKHIVARGWGLDVITRDPATLPARDDGRLRGLPENVRVFAIPQPKRPLVGAPARAWKAMKSRVPQTAPRLTVELRREELQKQSLKQQVVRGYLAWLDYVESGALAKSAARVALQLAKNTKYVAVASSGPPHMAHEAARLIAHKIGIPLVLDFRDPWSMQDRVGEDFTGLSISVTKFGLFVELTDLFVEGLVPLSSLSDDHYIYHESTREIIGQRNRKTYRLGQPVHVIVDRIDPVEKKIQFALLEEAPPQKAKRSKRNREKK